MNRDVAAWVVLIVWLAVIALVEFNPSPRTKDVCKCGVACECSDPTK